METEIGKKRTRRMRTKAERRGIVEETLAAGASVSRVARNHDVNANQVFNWRRLYRAGRLEAESCSVSLLPVKITGAVEKPKQVSSESSSEKQIGNNRYRPGSCACPN